MNDAMLWTFGLLGFLLLFFLVSIWFLNTGTTAVFKPLTSGGVVGRKDIADLKAGLEQIDNRLASIEQILQTVD